MTPRICVKRASRTLYGLVNGVSTGGAPVVLTRRGKDVAAIVPAGVVNVLAALRAQALPYPAAFRPTGGDEGPQGADGAPGDATPAAVPIPAGGPNGRAHGGDVGLPAAPRGLSPRDVEAIAVTLAINEGLPLEEARARVEASLARGDRALGVG